MSAGLLQWQIAQGQRHLASDGRRRILGQRCGLFRQRFASPVQSAEGHDAHLRIRILQQGLHRLLARLAQAGQQPNGPGPDEGVLIFEQTHQWFHGLVAVLEHSLLSRAADVD